VFDRTLAGKVMLDDVGISPAISPAFLTSPLP
jgi:hypothetical protein